MLKKSGAFFVILFSFILFFGLIFISSPYRKLRPYEFFGRNKTQDPQLTIRYINNRKTVYIPGNDSVSSFYIDQIPVTIADYKSCISSNGCFTQHYHDNYTNFWESKIHNHFPVTFVTWMEAQTFCNFYGGDLPSAEQWELAAGSEYKYDYPWGNDLPTIAKANIDGFYQNLTPAGWLPDGASPYGVLDMT